MRSFSSPAIKQTHFSEISLNLNKKNNSEKPNKTNITDEKMHRVKTLNQRAGAYQGGTSELQSWQHGMSQSAPKDGVFWLHFSSESTQLKLRVDQSRQTEKKNSRQKEGNKNKAKKRTTMLYDRDK